MLESATDPRLARSGSGIGRTRHLARLNAGDVPNLDASMLSVRDALSIREGDAFSEFRQVLRGALDTLDVGARSDQTDLIARTVFEDQMRDGAYKLKHRVGKASFKDRVRDTSVPLAIGAASAGFLAPLGPEFSAAGGSVASMSGAVWQWLMARRTPEGFKVAQRYVSMLGGVSRGSKASQMA